jgi:DNA polymerase-4
MARAVKACPKLVIVSSHFGNYREASQKVMERLWDLSDLVEQISIDEAFVDITDNPKPVDRLAKELQDEIRQELGLPNSLGVATNKLVAKIANDYGKKTGKKGIPPNAITIIQPGTEAEFLAPLAVEMLWGVGPKTAERLAELGIQKIGDLAQHPEIDLLRRYGKHGYDLSQRAKGIDNRPIVTEYETKSISQEVTYPRDINNETALIKTIEKQANHIAKQLDKKGLTARTVKIKLRWPDFTTLTRQMTLGQPTAEEKNIHNAALKLFKSVWSTGKKVRLLGVGVSGLESPPVQIGLWDVEWEVEYKIQNILLEVQEKFGRDIISRGITPAHKE